MKLTLNVTTEEYEQIKNSGTKYRYLIMLGVKYLQEATPIISRLRELEEKTRLQQELINKRISKNNITILEIKEELNNITLKLNQSPSEQEQNQTSQDNN